MAEANHLTSLPAYSPNSCWGPSLASRPDHFDGAHPHQPLGAEAQWEKGGEWS